MQIRRAVEADASAICGVVIASIVELCHADHQGDAAILDQWLANKTPQIVAGWIREPANINLVAIADGEIVAAGCVTSGGAIVLNYVAPSHRSQGVSSAMLSQLEDVAWSVGHASIFLESTMTAHSFYKKHHYIDAGEPETKFGLTAYPMRKSL